MLKELTNAVKRRIDPKTRLMIEIGYLNNELERTNTGIHQFLNFLEEKYQAQFVAYLKDLRDEQADECDED